MADAMRLARVQRERAEEARRALSSMDAVRRDREILEEGDSILIPLRGESATSLAMDLGFEVVEGHSPPRAHYLAPSQRIGDEIDIPSHLRSLLPRKWEKVGDVLIMKFPPQLGPFKEKVADGYARVLGARTVCDDVGGISGVFREPHLMVVLGRGTETIHAENGVKYMLDVARLMFSSGNIDERIRMGRIDCRGETVVDMFAGIGYFTLPMAVHSRPRKIVAIEINPVAYGYLVENVRLNGVEEIVEPVLGDCAVAAPEGIADRAVMGYVGTTDQYLDAGIAALRKGGVLHYHQTVPERLYPKALEEDLAEAAKRAGRTIKIERCARVKKYSPGMLHAVLDARVD